MSKEDWCHCWIKAPDAGVIETDESKLIEQAKPLTIKNV